nr:unnamed protein product [Callosobruchus analis]
MPSMPKMGTCDIKLPASTKVPKVRSKPPHQRVLEDQRNSATCANCQGDHPANFSKCPVYVSRLELLEEKREKITEPFMPAQPPAFNAWE